VADGNKDTAASIERLTVVLEQHPVMNKPSFQARKNCRKITFLGEQPDKVAFYLVALQDELNDGINDLLSNHAQKISTRHAEWLRSEFTHPVRSAYQEQAAKDPMSTATPFDSWSYPEDTVGFINGTSRECRGPVFPSPTGTTKHDINNTVSRPPKHPMQRNKTWLISTRFGAIYILLPRAHATSEDFTRVDEVGFSYTMMQRRASVHICARFLKQHFYASQPRICVQLNVFTQIQYDDWDDIYSPLFEEGTLADIDSALRAGTISSFHVDEDNHNLCLFVSIPRKTLKGLTSTFHLTCPFHSSQRGTGV
jgi:hypothetical protein